MYTERSILPRWSRENMKGRNMFQNYADVLFLNAEKNSTDQFLSGTKKKKNPPFSLSLSQFEDIAVLKVSPLFSVNPVFSFVFFWFSIDSVFSVFLFCFFQFCFFLVFCKFCSVNCIFFWFSVNSVLSVLFLLFFSGFLSNVVTCVLCFFFCFTCFSVSFFQ